ncbi:hypothetical protein [Sandaracinus amylolyticus]|uniref:hypothetical protein n=1 Tax=Sandaracinus amylolyticus TaxID=927083 RepID=UPI001F15BD51|nr:hypothetical protein [Sandaracinus amylolyticus]UJR87004.1 Hypothetical protein I5071_91050 [Sandaracinus amylolyticus]
MRRATRALLPAVLWLGACAPHDGIDSDLERSRTLASLSREESVALCEAHDAYLEMMWNDATWAEQRCVAIAIATPDVRSIEHCELIVQDCLENPDPYDHADCSSAGPAPAGCPITVGDSEDCRVDQYELTRNGGLACEDLTSPDLPERFVELWLESPPSCERLLVPECRPPR